LEGTGPLDPSHAPPPQRRRATADAAI